MFVPNRKQSSEAIQNALFDYLNLNRHKFDDHGNFDQTPDERDYVHPLLIVDDAKPPKWQIPKGARVPPPTTRFVAPGKVWRKPSYPADPTQPRHVNGKPVPLPKINRRYTPEECSDMFLDEIIQCKKEWEGKWPEYAYGKCIGRAKDRQNLCLMNGEYNSDSKPYSVNDLNDEDQKEYRRRKEKEERQEEVEAADQSVIAPPMVPLSDMNARTEALRLLQQGVERSLPANDNAQRPDLNARARVQMLWQPRYEGSIPANDNFSGRRNSILSARPRGPMIRVTPGMGYIGGMGKPQLLPRYPGDVRVPTKLY